MIGNEDGPVGDHHCRAQFSEKCVPCTWGVRRRRCGAAEDAVARAAAGVPLDFVALRFPNWNLYVLA